MVSVLTGKDRGKTGKVLRALPQKDRVVIEGVNLYKKHMRPRKEGEKGQTVVIPRSIHVSNVKKISEGTK